MSRQSSYEAAPRLTACPRITNAPLTSAWMRSSSVNRDLPTPLSPPTSQNRGLASRHVLRHSRWSSASCDSRPTNRADCSRLSRVSTVSVTSERPTMSASPFSTRQLRNTAGRGLFPAAAAPLQLPCHRSSRPQSPCSRVSHSALARSGWRHRSVKTDVDRKSFRTSAVPSCTGQSLVRTASLEDFGRHVRHGSDNHARVIEAAAAVLRDPEVQHFDGPLVGDEDVAGFQIAVKDPLPVQIHERVKHLHDQLDSARKVALSRDVDRSSGPGRASPCRNTDVSRRRSRNRAHSQCSDDARTRETETQWPGRHRSRSPFRL